MRKKLGKIYEGAIEFTLKTFGSLSRKYAPLLRMPGAKLESIANIFANIEAPS